MQLAEEESAICQDREVALAVGEPVTVWKTFAIGCAQFRLGVNQELLL